MGSFKFLGDAYRRYDFFVRFFVILLCFSGTLIFLKNYNLELSGVSNWINWIIRILLFLIIFVSSSVIILTIKERLQEVPKR